MLSTLASGLTTYIQASHGCPVAAFQVWIRSGGFDEIDGERGLAHLHEHMLFKGTPTRKVGEIAGNVEAAGGQINAWTSSDQTCYHVVMPAHSWRAGLDVLADIVCHSLFDAEELRREIEVVVEEIKRSEDSPSNVAYKRLFQMAYPGHPYALPVLGTAESVREMTSEKMRAFYKKHYVAPNAAVIAVGDFNAAEVQAAIAQAFIDLPTTPALAKPRAPKLPAAPRAEVLPATFSETRMIYAWPIPPLEHPDVPTLDVLALALGQGDSSRLVKIVQREGHLVNDIGTSAYTPMHDGLFTLTLHTSAERLAPARLASLQVVRQVCEDGIRQAELDKAISNMLADATYKLESVQGLAHAAGYFSAATGDPHWDRIYNQRIAAVTLADVLRVAKQYLRADSVQIVLLPGQDFTDVPSAETLLAETQQVLAKPIAVHMALLEPDVLDGIERIVLPSGDVLLVQPDSSVPVIGLRVATLGGVRDEDALSSGRGHLLAAMLTRGTARKSADDIAQQIESLAAGVGGLSGKHSLGLQAVTLKKTSDAVLDLLFDCLFDADLPIADLTQERNSQLEDIRHLADSPARVALRAMSSALHGDHPYGRDMLGDEASVTGLQRDDLYRYLRGTLVPGRLIYAAAGDVDPQELARAIQARTPLDRIADVLPQLPEMKALSSKIELRPTSQKQQAHIAIGFLAATLKMPEHYALQVLATILGGQSGRLFMELRDRQSLAYTVSAMNVDGLDAGHFALYIGTSPDKVEQALAGLWQQVDQLLQKPVAVQELERAKQSLAGGHAIGLQRRNSRAGTICMHEVCGLGRDAYRGELQALLAVSVEDVLGAARRFLDKDHCVEVVLR